MAQRFGAPAKNVDRELPLRILGRRYPIDCIPERTVDLHGVAGMPHPCPRAPYAATRRGIHSLSAIDIHATEDWT